MKHMMTIRNLRPAREIRAEKKMGVSIAPLTPGIYLPTKRSYNADYNFNEDHNLGLEYISGTLGLKLSKIQIAELKESLLLIPYRYYFGSNSFYLKAGLGRRKYTVVLGDSILETVADAFGSDILPHIKSLDIRSYILLLGLGNQWQHDSGFYLGVDWLELFVPIGGVKTNEKITPYLQGKDKDNMDKIIKVMESVPSLNVLKVKLGWSF